MPWIDADIDEVEPAGLRVGGAVGEPKADHHIALIRTLRGGTTPDLQELALGHWKGDVDRVLGHDRGERAALGADQVADRVLGTADASGEWRLDLGIGQIEHRLLEGGLLALEIAARLALLGLGLVELLLGGRLPPDQLSLPVDLKIGELKRGLGAGDGGLDLVDGCLVLTLLQHEEQIAGLDLGTLLEELALKVARHPRAEVHAVDRLDPGGEGRGRRHLAFLHQGNGDRRSGGGWRGRGLSLTLVASSGSQGQADDDHQPRDRRQGVPNR